MNREKFPIVKIDRTTAQEMLPIFINKGIFSNYKALPTKEEFLTKAKAELGVETLTKEQERSALQSEKMYRTTNYVVRNFGNYEVGFGLSFLMNNQSEDQLVNALSRVSLYKLGHRIASLILAEVYIQGKTTDLVISKERLLESLGYSSYEKQIYARIDNVMFSLMTLNYFIHEYKTNVTGKLKSKELGWFIYAVKSDHKNYTLSVNKNFVGCIASVMNNEEEAERDFSRGYFTYPTSILPASKDYSTAAYLLSNFLIMDSGNAKLNNGEVKIVAYSIRRLLDVMKIEAARNDHAKKAFLDALAEVKIINKTTPTLKELSSMKSSRLLDQVIHIQLPSDAEKLDRKIKSNHLPTK